MRDYYESESSVQVFKIFELKVPDWYRGEENWYQADIAVARLNASIIYRAFITPICLTFPSHDMVRLNVSPYKRY